MSLARENERVMAVHVEKVGKGEEEGRENGFQSEEEGGRLILLEKDGKKRKETNSVRQKPRFYKDSVNIPLG